MSIRYPPPQAPDDPPAGYLRVPPLDDGDSDDWGEMRVSPWYMVMIVCLGLSMVGEALLIFVARTR